VIAASSIRAIVIEGTPMGSRIAFHLGQEEVDQAKMFT